MIVKITGRKRKSRRKDGFGKEEGLGEKHAVCGLNLQKGMSGRRFEMENWHIGKRSGLAILNRAKNRSSGSTTIWQKRM